MIWPQNYKVSEEGFFEVLDDTRFDTQPVSIDIPIYQIDKDSNRVVNIYNHPSEIDFLSKRQVRMFVKFDEDVEKGKPTQEMGMLAPNKYLYLHYSLVPLKNRRTFCNTRNNK